MTTRFRVAATVAVLSAAVAAPASAHTPPATSPQIALDWNQTAVATLAASGKPQTESMIYMGLTQAAVYDAVTAIEGGFEPYRIRPGVPPHASPEAAAAVIGVDVDHYTYTAAPGELNDLRITYYPTENAILFDDRVGIGWDQAADCQAGSDSSQVVCAMADGTVVDLGDGNDYFEGGDGSEVGHGGPGNDDLRATGATTSSTAARATTTSRRAPRPRAPATT